MTKRKITTEWMAPMLVVVAILAIWMSLTYLPLSAWGIDIPTDTLWQFLPWIVALVVGLYALKEVYTKK